MTEYVVTIAAREKGRPLSDKVLLEMGTDATKLPESLEGIVGLLRTLGTPEKVVQFMRQNAVAAEMTNLIKQGT